MSELHQAWPAVATVGVPIAHLTHWYFMPLYALPVLLVLGSAIAATIRERRAAQQEPPNPKGGAR